MAPRRQNPPLTAEQTALAEQETRKTSRLYRAESSAFSDERISAAVDAIKSELEAAAQLEPISFADTARIKRLTASYLTACSESSTIPTVFGLCRALGISRTAFYRVMRGDNYPDTAAWFALLSDAFADVLAQSSLRNDTNPIVSIFLQKAIYGLRDTLEIVTKADEDTGDEISADDLARRIAGTVVFDE